MLTDLLSPLICNSLLKLYFNWLLNLSSKIPPPWSYKILKTTGHLFRNKRHYAAWLEQGILLKALNNIMNANIGRSPKAVIKEHLKFESRFIIENFWIQKQNNNYILNAFDKSDCEKLNNLITNDKFVIMTLHTSGFLLIVALINLLKKSVPFICMNPMKQAWETATPIQRSYIKAMSQWIHYQEHFFTDQGKIIEKSCNAIESGQSVIMTIDVPGYANHGLRSNMLNHLVWIPAGGIKIAVESNVPILIAIPWSTRCDKPYNIFIDKIYPETDMNSTANLICRHIDNLIKKAPECWSGWLYIDKMI